jgi:hypothetical protein
MMCNSYYAHNKLIFGIVSDIYPSLIGFRFSEPDLQRILVLCRARFPVEQPWRACCSESV